MEKGTIGINLFGMAKWLTDDWEKDAVKLKKAGMDSVELNLCILPGNPQMPEKSMPEQQKERMRIRRRSSWDMETARKKIEIARKAGLKVFSAQLFDINRPEELWQKKDELSDFLIQMKIPYVVLSIYHLPDEDFYSFCPVIAGLTEEYRKKGITFLYHNHDSELRKVNGVRQLDRFLERCPETGIELDVGWAVYAGMKLKEGIRKYADRIKLLHLKDYNEAFHPQDGAFFFVPIGDGALKIGDLKEVCMEAFEKMPYLILDIDDSDGDMYEAIKKSLQNMRKTGLM